MGLTVLPMVVIPNFTSTTAGATFRVTYNPTAEEMHARHMADYRSEVEGIDDKTMLRRFVPWDRHLSTRERKSISQHEFNRRFLLRPLQGRPNTQGGATLLRATEG